MKAREREDLLKTLRARFEKNMSRHKGIEWGAIQAKLEGKPEALKSLLKMERTGGERTWIAQDRKRATTRFAISP